MCSSAGDLHALQRSSHTDDEALAEVVGERTHALDVVHLHHDGFRLRLTDPDGQQPLAVALLEDHDV